MPLGQCQLLALAQHCHEGAVKHVRIRARPAGLMQEAASAQLCKGGAQLRWLSSASVGAFLGAGEVGEKQNKVEGKHFCRWGGLGGGEKS